MSYESLSHSKWDCSYHVVFAIAVARQFGGRKKNFNGEKFWARGYAVSTVGFEEQQILKYIENQQQLAKIKAPKNPLEVTILQMFMLS
jgi:REP element-mobilizing transposase RayT